MMRHTWLDVGAPQLIDVARRTRKREDGGRSQRRQQRPPCGRGTHVARGDKTSLEVRIRASCVASYSNYTYTRAESCLRGAG